MKLYGVRAVVSRQYVRKVMVDAKFNKNGKSHYFSSISNFVSLSEAELYLKFASESDIQVELISIVESVEQ